MHITITDPIDKKKKTTYPFPKDPTFRETDLVKMAFGLLAGDMWTALLSGDNAGAGAYALIALRRDEQNTESHELIARILDMPAKLVAVDLTPDAKKPRGRRPPADAPGGES